MVYCNNVHRLISCKRSLHSYFQAHEVKLKGCKGNESAQQGTPQTSNHWSHRHVGIYHHLDWSSNFPPRHSYDRIRAHNLGVGNHWRGHSLSIGWILYLCANFADQSLRRGTGGSLEPQIRHDAQRSRCGFINSSCVTTVFNRKPADLASLPNRSVCRCFWSFPIPSILCSRDYMVSKRQYGRTSGMLSAAQFASNIFGPALAVIFLSIIGIAGILTIDIITFFVAIGALLFVHVPQPVITAEGQKSRGSLWKESAYGFPYIFKRRGLLGLLLVFFGINLVATFAFTLLAPMILARTGNDETALGIVQSAIGVGGVVGSIVLSIWGGPKRRIHGVLSGLVLVMLGVLFIGFGRNPYVWALAAFFTMFFIPIVQGSSNAIWQAKVAPDVQGRVFATRGIIATISRPVALLVLGPLADRVFEPAMMPGGSLVPALSWLVGTGPGAGMALMFIISGCLGMLVGLGGYIFRVVRNVEDILPDHT